MVVCNVQSCSTNRRGGTGIGFSMKFTMRMNEIGGSIIPESSGAFIGREMEVEQSKGCKQGGKRLTVRYQFGQARGDGLRC